MNVLMLRELVDVIILKLETASDNALKLLSIQQRAQQLLRLRAEWAAVCWAKQISDVASISAHIHV